MKWLLSVSFLAIVIVGDVSSIIGQETRGLGSSGGQQDKRGPTVRALNSLISDVFAPITEKLNLTQEQQFQIIAIIIETELRADPLLQTLASIDQQLTDLTFSDVLDENRLKETCENQAAILSEVTQMRLRGKARIYQALTVEQRGIVAQQFRTKAQGKLGPFTIY